MACVTFKTPHGAVIVCGARRRRRKCTNCGGMTATLECDAPVDRPARYVPREGEARVHRVHRVLFYVQTVQGDHVTISRTAEGGKTQLVTIDEWFSKTIATCDRAICERCVTKVRGLDYCGAHARAENT